MKWTAEKPTKSGFYWFRGPLTSNRPEPAKVVSGVFGTLFVWVCDDDTSFELKGIGGEWYGPIEPPEDAVFGDPHSTDPDGTKESAQ